jgi:hypothetical protein
MLIFLFLLKILLYKAIKAPEILILFFRYLQTSLFPWPTVQTSLFPWPTPKRFYYTMKKKLKIIPANTSVNQKP